MRVEKSRDKIKRIQKYFSHEVTKAQNQRRKPEYQNPKLETNSNNRNTKFKTKQTRILLATKKTQKDNRCKTMDERRWTNHERRTTHFFLDAD